jgi:purine-binding chemotaxis protein CheW
MATALAAPPTATKADERAGKYLSFLLGKEEFCIQVLKVREIIGLHDITVVPHAPRYVKGVINLRGRIIPVIELRLKLGFEEVAYSARTCIVVVQIQQENASLTLGVVVDGVSEVMTLQAADIEDTPNLGSDVTVIGLLGMAKVKGKVKILLDIDAVLSRNEVVALDQFLQ